MDKIDKQLECIINNSRLDYLLEVEFEEKTKGRYFQKHKTNLGNGYKSFYVVLAPDVKSPIHNHAFECMDETHLLLYGSGKFLVFDSEGNIDYDVNLQIGEFHEMFSTKDKTPNHQYIAGSEGSITLALEKH